VHRGDPPAVAMTQAPPSRPGRPARPGRSWHGGLVPLRTALGLFTILPVRAAPEIGGDDAARAVLWLPVVGLLLAVPAAAVLLAVEAGGHSGPRRLLAAALAIAVLALLTGGLHLDGLADTADGLGSRRPRDEALAIMRRSDIGPFGVAALLFTCVLQITALATVNPGWPAAAVLAGAAVTGRVAVVLATGPGTPAARPDGFGALVAGGHDRPGEDRREWHSAGRRGRDGCCGVGLVSGAAGRGRRARRVARRRPPAPPRPAPPRRHDR